MDEGEKTDNSSKGNRIGSIFVNARRYRNNANRNDGVPDFFSNAMAANSVALEPSSGRSRRKIIIIISAVVLVFVAAIIAIVAIIANRPPVYSKAEVQESYTKLANYLISGKESSVVLSTSSRGTSYYVLGVEQVQDIDVGEYVEKLSELNSKFSEEAKTVDVPEDLRKDLIEYGKSVSIWISYLRHEYIIRGMMDSYNNGGESAAKKYLDDIAKSFPETDEEGDKITGIIISASMRQIEFFTKIKNNGCEVKVYEELSEECRDRVEEIDAMYRYSSIYNKDMIEAREKASRRLLLSLGKSWIISNKLMEEMSRE